MNPAANKSTPEHELTKTLRRQAEHFSAQGGGSLDLAQVVSRAGEIRRGRRMRASMVMAAVVVAVAAPIGVTVLASDPAKEPTVASAPDHSDISLSVDISRGTAPRAGYLEGNALFLPNGKKQTVSGEGDVFAAARLDDGYLIAQNDSTNEYATARYLGDDGTESRSWPYDGNGFAVSPEGNVAAFVQPDGTVTAVENGGDRYFDVGSLPEILGGYVASAVVGENCSDRTEDSCTIYVTSAGRKQQVYAVRQHQDPEPVFPGFIDLNSVSGKLAAGMVSASDDGSCSEVREGAKTLWHTCKFSLESFSPDGRYLLAGPAYRDGPGAGQLTILDARTGDIVLHLGAVRDSIVNQEAWEDDTHVVAAVSGRGKWAITRFEVNGHREYATGRGSSDDAYVSPYVVPSR